ncbi:MAG TPA: radical SAM protein [Symbiobacteriaceae bacterium]|nr:radical SAM protein [Symbiobacteriaceae bacterium]
MQRLTYIDEWCKSVLNRVEGMPFNWSINPYAGCAHACHYCYARAFYTRAGRGGPADFDRLIYVKRNAPLVLRAELARRTWKRELVVVGAATDPYQPGEARFGITRGILEALLEYRTPVSLITKGPLVLRDLDLLLALKRVARVDVNVTVPTMDLEVWRRMEPGTPPPAARMRAVKRLNEAGIATGVFLAPILPGITDNEHSLRAVVEAAADAGAPFVMPVTLRLAPGVREWFMPSISKHYQGLTREYARLYQRTEAPLAYKAGTGALAKRLIQEYGLETGPGQAEELPAAVQQPVQMRLSL